MESYLYLINRRTLSSSPVLLYRAIAMLVHLEEQGVKCRITKFLRKKKTAHRWSTAHHIVNGQISIGALRNLTEGRDKDGNLWYKHEWDGAYTEHESASLCNTIKLNAVQLGAPGTVYAEEGYELNDPRRLPNIRDVAISKHVLGLAIDILIDWEPLDGAWSSRAQSTVEKFGLIRPRMDESWHFELKPNELFSISSYLHVAPHRVLLWAVRYLILRRKKDVRANDPGHV